MTKPDKLMIEAIELELDILNGRDSNFRNDNLRRVYLQLSEVMRENERLRSILQDYLNQQEGCPPSTIMNRMRTELDRNKPTVNKSYHHHTRWEKMSPTRIKCADCGYVPPDNPSKTSGG